VEGPGHLPFAGSPLDRNIEEKRESTAEAVDHPYPYLFFFIFLEAFHFLLLKVPS